MHIGLISDKDIILDGPVNDDNSEMLNHEAIIFEKLKKGIIKIENGQLRVCDDFKQSEVFVRHSKPIKVIKTN